jgi:hypothetical protein
MIEPVKLRRPRRSRISPCSFAPFEHGLDVCAVRTATDLAALPVRYRELRQPVQIVILLDMLKRAGIEE